MNSLRAPLEKLKQSYVNIFAIGIGRNINKGELQMMATEPVKEHVFYVADMQELQTLLTNIGESACKSKYIHRDTFLYVLMCYIGIITRPQRVWVLSRFGYKQGIDFGHFGHK